MLNYPDELGPTNRRTALVDGDHVRGGRRIVADRAELYTLGSNVDQLKEGVTVVRIVEDHEHGDQSTTVVLVSLDNIDNASGWEVEGGNAAIPTNLVTTDTDQTITGLKTYNTPVIAAYYIAANLAGGGGAIVFAGNDGSLNGSGYLKWNGNQIDITSGQNPGFRIFNGQTGFYFYNGAGGAGNFGIFDIANVRDRFILWANGRVSMGPDAFFPAEEQLHVDGNIKAGYFKGDVDLSQFPEIPAAYNTARKLANTFAAVMAGANGAIDTFIEAFNQFAQDKQAIDAMNAVIAGKIPYANLVSSITGNASPTTVFGTAQAVIDFVVAQIAFQRDNIYTHKFTQGGGVLVLNRRGNTNAGTGAVNLGGNANKADGKYALTAAGEGNQALAEYSSIPTGFYCLIEAGADYAIINGGQNNTITAGGKFSYIGNGYFCTIGSPYCGIDTAFSSSIGVNSSKCRITGGNGVIIGDNCTNVTCINCNAFTVPNNTAGATYFNNKLLDASSYLPAPVQPDGTRLVSDTLKISGQYTKILFDATQQSGNPDKFYSLDLTQDGQFRIALYSSNGDSQTIFETVGDQAYLHLPISSGRITINNDQAAMGGFEPPTNPNGGVQWVENGALWYKGSNGTKKLLADA